MNLKTLSETSVQKALLVAYYVLLAFTGILPAQWLALLMLAIAVCLIPYEEFLYLLPGALVYYSQFIIPVVNMSFYRAYTLMLFVKLIYMLITDKIEVKNDVVCIFIPLFLHALLSVTFANVRTGIFYVLDLIIMVCFFSSGLISEEQIKRALSFFAIACALSVLSGVMLDNYLDLSYELDQSWEAVRRFRGTFIDPNYCGFLYTFSILFCLCLKPFKTWQRIFLMLVLVVGIVMTISFSSYISFVAICFLYVVLNKKVNFKTIAVSLVIIAALICLYIYGLNNPDVEIIGDVVYRIQSYTADTSTAENRSQIWKKVFAAYEDQNVFKQLFGMNPHAPVLNMNVDAIVPAHNDYMEMLYNCGLLLTVMFYLGIIGRIFAQYKSFKNDGDQKAGFVVLSKLLWFVFSFTLSLISEKVFLPILFL